MLFDFLIKKQTVELLEWEETTEGILAWRFPLEGLEIAPGASLSVHESQMALFVHDGEIADVFGPGHTTLTPQTLPVLANLKGWDESFNEAFTCEVYFFTTRVQAGREWETVHPFTLQSTEIDLIHLQAWGTYAYRIANPKVFFTETITTKDTYSRVDAEVPLRALILSTMENTLGTSRLPFLDMAANPALIVQQVAADLSRAFEGYGGLELQEFTIVRISLPESFQPALDERLAARMKEGVSADVINSLPSYQVSNAYTLAPHHDMLPSSPAGTGNGATTDTGALQALQGLTGIIASHSATAEPSATATIEARLEKLKGLMEKNLILEDEYKSAKAELIRKLIDE